MVAYSSCAHKQERRLNISEASFIEYAVSNKGGFNGTLGTPLDPPLTSLLLEVCFHFPVVFV